MREIKFRAWDGQHMIFFDLSLCNEESRPWFENTIADRQVMQYTGLKDKNGVEIYEGDVVQYGNKVGDIVWRNAVMIWEGPDRAGDMSPHYDPLIYPVDSLMTLKGEVIGNIHETKQEN